MFMEPAAWMVVQLALGLGTWPAASWVQRHRPGAAPWVLGAMLGLLLVWPLMRFFPEQPIRWLGAGRVACVELTGLFVPASMLFLLAARRVPRASDGRALRLLVGICLVYFLRVGWWMIRSSGPEIGETRMEGGVCLQSTGYTCVAASCVTVLRARGIDASEAEMARLSRTEVNGGATDSRAVWALETALTGTDWRVDYRVTDLAGLAAAPKPCMAQIGWGFFMAHMVAVMDVEEETVVLGDPLSGVRRVKASEFEKTWKGRVISVSPR